MVEGRATEFEEARVHELEGQVTAFTDLGEAIRAVDDVLGQATRGLTGAEGRSPLGGAGAHRREVRNVVLA